MANVSPSPKLQFLDSAGNPLVGGKLYTYSAGTTTPLATYTDAGGLTANANPVILDSRGEANVWLGTSQYKFKLTTSADVELWTVDNLNGTDTVTLNAANAALTSAVDALAASTGSSLVGFIQSGTAAVATTVQTKLRRVQVDVADFGTIGNSTTGDDTVFQAAIDYMHKLSDDSGAYGTLVFDGTIYLASPKLFGKNWTLQGRGRGFNSVIKPLATFSGSYLFGIDGSTCIGGYAFRIRHKYFTIDNSLITTKARIAKTYYINSAYDIGFDDVWIYNYRGTAMEIGASNLVTITNASIYGVTADASNSEYGIRVISAGAGGGGGGVKIINPDIEVVYKGISQEAGSRVEIINPYCERNIIGWQGTGTTSGSLTVVGGEIESPGASGIAATISGDNVTVVGGIYKANGGIGLYVDPAARKANLQLLGVSGDISDSRNYAQKLVTDSTNWYPSTVTNYKTPADAVATTFFNVTVPFNANYFGVLEVTVNARDNSGYSIWTGKYRVALANADGTLRATAVTEYGKANSNASANYTLSIACAMSLSGTTASFQITADTGGALGAGLASRVSASAELVQWDSAGAVYLTSV